MRLAGCCFRSAFRDCWLASPTPMQAQLVYQDRIRAHHAALRRFYYGYLFTDKPFGKEDFDRAPRFGSP